VDPTTADLLNDLNEGSNGISDEAKFSLIGRGSSVIAPLVDMLPSLNRLGQLNAIEVLRELRATEAGLALLPLLRSGHETVRDWSAQARENPRATVARERELPDRLDEWLTARGATDRSDGEPTEEQPGLRALLASLL
jgi:hypothetical protein